MNTERAVSLARGIKRMEYMQARADAAEAYLEAGNKGIELWIKHGQEWREHLK